MITTTTRQPIKHHIPQQILALLLAILTGISFPGFSITSKASSYYRSFENNPARAQHILDNVAPEGYGKNAVLEDELVKITLPENEAKQVNKYGKLIAQEIKTNNDGSSSAAVSYSNFTKDQSIAEIAQLIYANADSYLNTTTDPAIIYNTATSNIFIQTLLENRIDNNNPEATLQIGFNPYKTNSETTDYCEKEIKKIYNKLDLKGKSDKEKLRIIYNYVRKNFKVNTELNQYTVQQSNSMRNADYALKTKKATCGGFAEIIYRLALFAGVKHISLNKGFVYAAFAQNQHVWVSYDSNRKHYVIDAAVGQFWVTEDESYTRNQYDYYTYYLNPEVIDAFNQYHYSYLKNLAKEG